MKRKSLIVKVLAMMTVAGLLSVTGVLAAEETITGYIEKNASGQVVLSADNGESFIVKGQDLSGMVGKSVQVTGTLEEGDGGKSIMVNAVEEIKE